MANMRNMIRHKYQGVNGENQNECEDTPENRQYMLGQKALLGGTLQLIDYQVFIVHQNEFLIDPNTSLNYVFDQADDATIIKDQIADQAANDKRGEYDICPVKTISANQPAEFLE